MIDISKEYKTRDGRDVRVLMTDGGGVYPVIGALRNDDNTWTEACWLDNGKFIEQGRDDDGYDLIEMKPEPKALAFRGDPRGRVVRMYRGGGMLPVP